MVWLKKYNGEMEEDGQDILLSDEIDIQRRNAYVQEQQENMFHQILREIIGNSKIDDL